MHDAVKAPTTPKGMFFCKGHCIDLPIGEQNKTDKRYCNQCYAVIKAEADLLELKIQSSKETRAKMGKVTEEVVETSESKEVKEIRQRAKRKGKKRAKRLVARRQRKEGKRSGKSKKES